MKKIIFTIVIFSFLSTFAQDKTAEKKEGWDIHGKNTFLFNQSAFSNWASGGDNTLAGNINVNYDFNYKKNKFSWNNKIRASYGLTKSKSVDFPKKTDDGFSITSLLGFDADKNWFYSILINFKTQFTKGYKYEKDANGKEFRTEYTNFMSPGYLLIGPGMLWEKSSNLKFNLAPATSRFTFVNKDFTLPNSDYFGVKEGESLLYELGFSASFYSKFDIMENITIENIVAFYSNYLDKPQNIDMNYALNITMKVNKIFSANLLFKTIYDDSAFSGFQLKEVLGIGLNYEI